MKWSSEAEEAVSKVPFFVRGKVRRKVQEEASRSGAATVEMRHVIACRQQYLQSMDEEVKGFQLEACFGSGACSHRAQSGEALLQRLKNVLTARNLKAFLKARVRGPLKLHHEFRVSVSDCPNACSRPQIADLGLVGAIRPRISSEPCSECGVCTYTCTEGAITLSPEMQKPSIDLDKCVMCGKCITVCPGGVFMKAAEGWRILVGGKLGRHPRLGTELRGLFTEDEVIGFVEECLDYYQTHNSQGERLGEMIERNSCKLLSVSGHEVEREKD